MRRRVWLALGALLLVAAICAPLTLFAVQRLFRPPEVRPPYPTAQLVNSHAGLSADGWHTIRVYQVRGDIRDVIDWYRAEGGGTSARVPGSVASQCTDNVVTAASPKLPLRWWVLAPVTRVRYCPAAGGVDVITDTYLRWQPTRP